MEKQLGWAHKLGGTESLGIFKAGQTLLARLIESQIWHQLTNSVGQGFRKGTMATACLDARHYSSLCMPLVPFMLLPWCWSSEGVTLNRWVCVWILWEELFGAPEVSSTDSIPAGFCSQKLLGLTFLALEPWGREPGVRLELLIPEISLLNFHPPHRHEGTAHSASLPLLPVWMDVVALIPQLSNFHSTKFLTILSDGSSIH